ncbi:MAG: tetratricopeptide repeat protein, partial [Thermoflexales bacterium]
MTEPPRNTFDAALQDGEASLRSGEPRLTVARCSEVLASHPDSVRALRLRGRAFDALSNFQRAAADYLRVLDIAPLDIESMVSLALCQQDLRKGADALTMARQALEHEPMNDDALRLLRESGEEAPDRGRLAMLRQKYDAGAVRKVILEMRRLVEVLPDRPDVQTLLAEMHFRSGAPIAAAEACQRLLDDQPDCLPAHALLALVWQKAGAEVVASAHLREVERLDPDFREIA